MWHNCIQISFALWFHLQSALDFLQPQKLGGKSLVNERICIREDLTGNTHNVGFFLEQNIDHMEFNTDV